MEEKHEIYEIDYKRCEDVIADIVRRLENTGSEINLYEARTDRTLWKALIPYIKNKIKDAGLDALDGINENQSIKTMINLLADIQDEEFTFNLFIYYLQNRFDDFMNLLTHDYRYLRSKCRDLINEEFPHISEEDAIKFCEQFNTVEDYIRLHPAIYNMLYDAFYTVVPIHNRDKLNKLNFEDIPDDIINTIAYYYLKYDRPNNMIWRYRY